MKKISVLICVISKRILSNYEKEINKLEVQITACWDLILNAKVLPEIKEEARQKLFLLLDERSVVSNKRDKKVFLIEKNLTHRLLDGHIF